jgi:hypothetical protein
VGEKIFFVVVVAKIFLKPFPFFVARVVDGSGQFVEIFALGTSLSGLFQRDFKKSFESKH